MKITKLTIKLFLIISLFASIALADGHMGGGGFAEDGHTGSGNYTCNAETHENCPQEDGHMGGGGLADSTIIFIKNYLAKLFG